MQEEKKPSRKGHSSCGERKEEYGEGKRRHEKEGGLE